MSGRHRVVKPRRRAGVVSAVGRWPRSLTCLFPGSGKTVLRRAWARLVERARDRFEREDPFAGVTLDPQATSPDPVPAPVVEPAPEPLVLAPEQVLPVLHTHHPDLPGSSVQWHVHAAGVHGEVNSLDADEGGQRRAVNAYAAAFDAEVVEDVDGTRLLVSTTGVFGGVPVTVAATFVDADTMPLPAYREAAGCLETQHIPDEILREVA